MVVPMFRNDETDETMLGHRAGTDAEGREIYAAPDGWEPMFAYLVDGAGGIVGDGNCVAARAPDLFREDDAESADAWETFVGAVHEEIGRMLPEMHVPLDVGDVDIDDVNDLLATALENSDEDFVDVPTWAGKAIRAMLADLEEDAIEEHDDGLL